MRRLLPSFLSSLLLASLAACGSGTAREETMVATELPADVGAQSIHALDMKRHVELLASDAFEGRETLQPGYEKAAAYIANEFSRYGLVPMPGQQSLVVPYQLWKQGFDDQKTRLALTTSTGETVVPLGSGAAPFAFSDDGVLDAGVVFAGYGITAEEAKYDDYEGLDVKGKWVLVLRHAPGYVDAKSPFFGGERKDGSTAPDLRSHSPVTTKAALKGERKDDSAAPDLRSHSAFMTKALNAQKHGAKGMLLVSGPVTAEMPDDLRMPQNLMVPRTPEETAKLEARMKERQARAQASAAKADSPSDGQGKSQGKSKGKSKGKDHGKSQGKSKGKGKGKGKSKSQDSAQSKSKAQGKPAPVEEQTLLAFHISTQMGTQLLAETGKTLAQLQREVDAGTKAKDIVLTATASASVQARKEPATVEGKNIIAYLEGSDPALKDQFVVIGGHFDHLGGFGVSDAAGQDTVYNGADDNASGTAGVLELAEAFASAAVAPKRSMLFMAFSAEEKGLLGSRALVKQGDIDTNKVAFMLNLDMIGRNNNEPVEFVGGDYATDIRAIAEAANNEVDLPVHYVSRKDLAKRSSAALGANNRLRISLTFGPYAANSDHHAFFEKEVPVAFFFTGLHDDYHQLSDHADKLDYTRMEDIVKLGFGLANAVANAETRPTFIHKLDWLGASLQVGTVSAIEADARATLAGLKVGDVVSKIGELSVVGGIAQEDESRSAGRVLAEMEPGSSTTLGIVREGQAMELTLERAKRGYLGIMPGRMSDEVRQKFGMDKSEGVLIGRAVKDAPAQKSGLKDGDIITKLGGHPVNMSTLMKRLSRIGAGETITVQVIRAGKRIEMPLTLGEPPTR